MQGALPQLLYYLWDLEEQRNGRQEGGFTVKSEKNRASSLLTSNKILHSCKKLEKTYDQFLKKKN